MVLPAGNKDNIRENYNVEFGRNYYLKITINGYDVEPYCSIVSIIVREWIFDLLPRLELEILDNGRFTDQYPFQDNDEIKVELNNMRQKKPVVDATFILQDYNISEVGVGERNKSLIKLTGLLKASNLLYPIKNRAFEGKNSKEVFEELVGESSELTFKSRITPKDSMNWLQLNQNNFQFFNHVLKRSFTKENDFNLVFTNRNSEVIYTSLNTEVSKQKDEVRNLTYKKGASVLNSANFSEEQLENRLFEEEQEEPKTDFYFEWIYKNVAGTMNKINSYGRSYNYYDVFNEEEIPDVTKNIKTDDFELTENSLKEKRNVGKIVNKDVFGVWDSQNTYPSYLDAMIQREYLSNNFFSSYLVVYARPTRDINLLDIVNVRLPAGTRIETTSDQVHSGYYMVGGIIHHAEINGLFDDILILFRNGLNLRGNLRQGDETNS